MSPLMFGAEVVVPSLAVFVALVVPVTFAAVLVLYWLPRDSASDLLMETVDATNRELRGAVITAAERDERVGRLEAVDASVRPVIGLGVRQGDQWSPSAVMSAAIVVRGVDDVRVDDLDWVIGRAWLRSSPWWWLWAVGVGIAAAAADPALVVHPRSLRNEIRSRAAALAARHRERQRRIFASPSR